MNPTDFREIHRPRWGALLTVLAIALAVGGCNEPKKVVVVRSPEPEPETPRPLTDAEFLESGGIIIAATELRDSFKADEAAAQRRIDGKQVRLTGQIMSRVGRSSGCPGNRPLRCFLNSIWLGKLGEMPGMKGTRISNIDMALHESLRKGMSVSVTCMSLEWDGNYVNCDVSPVPTAIVVSEPPRYGRRGVP